MAQTPPMAAILALLNPGSGSADPAALEAELRERLDDIEVLLLPEDGDLVRFIDERVTEHRPEVLVASGGDGTVSAAATALRGSKLPLAVLPSGTANLFSLELATPSNVDALVEAIQGGHVRRCDAGDMDGQRMLCRMGVGTMGEIGPNTNPKAKRLLGPLSYAWTALPFVVDTPRTSFALDLDGTTVQVEGSSVIVTNIGAIGYGDLRWGPEVLPDDGALDVFVVHSARLGENLDVLWNAMGGDASSSGQISHARVQDRVVIRPSCDASAVFDGESMRCPEYSVRVRPGDLHIVTAAPQA